MPVKGQVPWLRKDHTAAKHTVYDHYLRKWFPILLGGSISAYRSLTYAEGFSGPGVYADGADGSPIIAMRAFLEQPRLANGRKPVRFVFVDDDPRCIRLLDSQIKKNFPDRIVGETGVSVHLVQGTCAEKLESTLDAVGAWDYPILAVLDSWGNAPVPYDLIVRLARNRATEVIVTLAPRHFVRFVSRIEGSGDEVFGGDQAWREIVNIHDGPRKQRHLLTCYRQMLQGAGFSYLLDFELVDRRGESLYLVFGTNHKKGVEKMKDALWTVDPRSGVRFRDPRDAGQYEMFELDEPEFRPLARLLSLKLRTEGPKKVHELRAFTLVGTVFQARHVMPAVEMLLAAGEIRSVDELPVGLNSLVRAVGGAPD